MYIYSFRYTLWPPRKKLSSPPQSFFLAIIRAFIEQGNNIRMFFHLFTLIPLLAFLPFSMLFSLLLYSSLFSFFHFISFFFYSPIHPTEVFPFFYSFSFSSKVYFPQGGVGGEVVGNGQNMYPCNLCIEAQSILHTYIKLEVSTTTLPSLATIVLGSSASSRRSVREQLFSARRSVRE